MTFNKRLQSVLLFAASASIVTVADARAQSGIVAWGGNASGQCNVPALPPKLAFVEIDAGELHTVARRSDGTLAAWGYDYYGQCDVPALPPGITYVEVAAGDLHTVARRSDGSVVAWGFKSDGQCNVPAQRAGFSFVDVAAGRQYTLARRSDGSILGWGRNDVGQCNAPALPLGVLYVDVAAGGFHSLARRSDDVVVAWGANVYGQCNVPSLPQGLSYLKLAAGEQHSLALRSDGALVAWGSNGYGQCNVPPLAPGLSYVEVEAGNYFTIARRSDGAVVAFGQNDFGQCNVPAPPVGLKFVELGAGYHHAVARTEPTGGCTQTVPNAPTLLDAQAISGTQIALSWTDPAVNEDGFDVERAAAGGAVWLLLGTLAPDSTAFHDTTVACGSAYDYRVSAFNCAGASGSSQASVSTAACCATPFEYCAPKVNSIGCSPSMGWSGTPTASGPVDDFRVSASGVLNRKPGLLVWSTSPGSSPLGGGTLCVASPVIRTSVQSSGGSAAPLIDCSGRYAFHFDHAYLQFYFLTVGQTICAQFWSRDPGFAAPNNIGLTNGLWFEICP